MIRHIVQHLSTRRQAKPYSKDLLDTLSNFYSQSSITTMQLPWSWFLFLLSSRRPTPCSTFRCSGVEHWKCKERWIGYISPMLLSIALGQIGHEKSGYKFAIVLLPLCSRQIRNYGYVTVPLGNILYTILFLLFTDVRAIVLIVDRRSLPSPYLMTVVGQIPWSKTILVWRRSAENSVIRYIVGW